MNAICKNSCLRPGGLILMDFLTRNSELQHDSSLPPRSLLNTPKNINNTMEVWSVL